MARNDTDTDAETNYEQITLDELRDLQEGDRVRVAYEPANRGSTQEFEATVADIDVHEVDGHDFDTITLLRDGDDITRRRLYNVAGSLDVEGRRTTEHGPVWARLNRHGLDVVTVEVLVEDDDEAHKAAVREMLNEKVEDFKAKMDDDEPAHTATLTYENTIEGADGHTKTETVEVLGHVIADFPDDGVVYFEGIEYTGAFMLYDDGTVEYTSTAVCGEYEVGVNGTVEDFSGYEDDQSDDDDIRTDGGVAVDDAGGCPHGNERCDGTRAAAERPELCFPCWREWSAYDPDDYLADDDEDEDARDDEGKPPADHSEADADPREADDYGVPTCAIPTCNAPAPADSQSSRQGFCDEHAARAEVFGGFLE